MTARKIGKIGKEIKGKQAVSPVVGVLILLVITVIMAATIGAFVLGMKKPEAAPQASMAITKVDEANERIYIEHQGGDSINLNRVKIVAWGEGDTKREFDPADNTTTWFEPGDELTLDLDDGWIQLNGVTTLRDLSGDDGCDFEPNDPVYVRIIDKDTGQLIASLEATA
ncbi:MAG TPA: type IV pilin [Methanomicrobia archaeon]|nr:type IV pilin [Methanomicrobia archaeon]HEX59988.1 type IV pilin [Methanomicrobia archaeon]